MKKLKKIMSFYTTADALETEDILISFGYFGRLIPVPRNMSAGCGLAFEMDISIYNQIPENILNSLPEFEQITEMYL